MKKNGDFYCYDPAAEVTSVNVIFSDKGASQTDDLSTASGSCYLNGSWESLSDCGFTVNGGESGGETTGETKVCYDNTPGFAAPYLYFWNVDAVSSVSSVAFTGRRDEP